MSTLLQDLRFAIRQMRRSPGFAATAVITLALGIGANVVVFGVLQALVLRSIDAPHADRIMTMQPNEKGNLNLSWSEVKDVRDSNTVFSAIAADRIMDFGLEARGVTHPVWGYEVSGQYFEVVGIQPAMGRLLQRADDDHPGAAEVAVLSWGAWKNYYGGDPAIVGKTIRIDKHPYTIVGVTPASFYGTEKFLQPDIYVPMTNEAEFEGYNWLNERGDHNVWSIVRLKDGVTPPQVQAELNTITARVAHQFPNDEEHWTLKLSHPGLLGDVFGGPARGFLAGIMALAGIVLLAACANLGSLFAARTADRTREIAIRMAVGSSRWRVIRQILTEAVVIAIIGGACACALAWTALSALAAWHPPTNFPLRFAVLPQPALIATAFLISIFAGALFGAIPLRQIFKTDPNEAIKSGSSQAAGRRWAFRDVLLAGQIALCCVTVTAAFVALRGMQKSLNMDFGFRPENAVLTKFELGLAGYDADNAEHFQRELLERAKQLPGVEAVGYANTTPLALDQSNASVYAQQTVDFRPSTQAFLAAYFNVGPGYFRAAGTKLLFGRDVSFNDTKKTPNVAVVNQEFARRLFHTDNAAGRYFKDGGGDLIQIAGVVEDGKYQVLGEPQGPAMFFPITQRRNSSTVLVIRTRMDPNVMAASMLKLVHDIDPGVPIQESSSWIRQLGMQLFPARAASIALSLFGIFGLLLSITGTFGLASYTVAKRMRELSIRVALGAKARQVISAALGRMLILLAGGSVAGILLGVAASRLLSAIVYQASAQDPLVLLAVALTMLITGVLSIAGPVSRTLNIDPARILREE
jgi:predicted permease